MDKWSGEFKKKSESISSEDNHHRKLYVAQLAAVGVHFKNKNDESDYIDLPTEEFFANRGIDIKLNGSPANREKIPELLTKHFLNGSGDIERTNKRGGASHSAANDGVFVVVDKMVKDGIDTVDEIRDTFQGYVKDLGYTIKGLDGFIDKTSDRYLQNVMNQVKRIHKELPATKSLTCFHANQLKALFNNVKKYFPGSKDVWNPADVFYAPNVGITDIDGDSLNDINTKIENLTDQGKLYFISLKSADTDRLGSISFNTIKQSPTTNDTVKCFQELDRYYDVEVWSRTDNKTLSACLEELEYSNGRRWQETFMKALPKLTVEGVIDQVITTCLKMISPVYFVITDTSFYKRNTDSHFEVDDIHCVIESNDIYINFTVGDTHKYHIKIREKSGYPYGILMNSHHKLPKDAKTKVKIT